MILSSLMDLSSLFLRCLVVLCSSSESMFSSVSIIISRDSLLAKTIWFENILYLFTWFDTELELLIFNILGMLH